MSRKRITQIFPQLLPLRKKQRLFCFYLGMRLDGRRYASKQLNTVLPHRLFESSCPMYNHDTGCDMKYQENKVFNLKLAAKTLDKLLIRPGETFSFWNRVGNTGCRTPYRDGLAVSDGKLQALPGGGLCQMSNLLFWIFLHTPLTVTERHGHRVKDFPESPSDAQLGVDATVSEGWLDLRVRNDTEYTFQLSISFDEGNIIGGVWADFQPTAEYLVENGKPLYIQKNGRIFEEVDIIQNIVSLPERECISSKLLYRNRCEIRYPLFDAVEWKDLDEGRALHLAE